MNKVSRIVFWFCSVLSVLAAAEPPGLWPGFRGSGDSHSAARLPLSWSGRHNLAWKIATPGFGQSTPVVHAGRIFLTAVEGPRKEKLLVLSLDARTGKEIWRKAFDSSRPQEAGERVARAASTPALDGESLYAMFDSGDLLALDHDGAVKWKKNFNTDYGPINNGHDFGSSLRQSADTLYAFVQPRGSVLPRCHRQERRRHALEGGSAVGRRLEHAGADRSRWQADPAGAAARRRGRLRSRLRQAAVGGPAPVLARERHSVLVGLARNRRRAIARQRRHLGVQTGFPQTTPVECQGRHQRLQFTAPHFQTGLLRELRRSVVRR